ncbi:quinone oxidoreductase-related [Anaeramoeba flamelloides]|uniref:Probable quinone oxidoreductase n=1 Tax=Anaeramoeba flamelloides TaxID=1746091 RepID=A0AAV7YBU1_9EUKA|nr:quinone oxidoreductase-related [Anaeramoeba flamelloides]KAJ6242798.1 quinone oxidoreductase-related [Anaeramoeba flamelloides]|eukprot:Anaeramoba_flamelloidesa336354_293.p1 GENE.a336354_293~~a336354_293.p1  ORF type:complete len:330 (+),score=66.68 a336354_293:30-992(+)
MKAVVIKKTGSFEVLEYTNTTKPKVVTGQVLVKNVFAGLNYIDTYHRSGLYPKVLPFILGVEGSGTIEEIGENTETDLQIGDRVAYFYGGSYAEYTAVPVAKIVKLPNSISFIQGAASMIQGMTAFYLTNEIYKLQEGDWCLIHAGAGGVGSLAIQMAKHLGATVVTTVSTEEKAKLVKKLGADHVIMYKDVNFAEALLELRPQGCELVLDGVGQATFQNSIKCTKTRGYLASFGNASGPVKPIPLLQLARSIKVTRPSLFHYVQTKEEFTNKANKVFELFEKNIITLKESEPRNLSDVKQVHIDLESRKTTGKIVMRID